MESTRLPGVATRMNFSHENEKFFEKNLQTPAHKYGKGQALCPSASKRSIQEKRQSGTFTRRRSPFKSQDQSETWAR